MAELNKLEDLTQYVTILDAFVDQLCAGKKEDDAVTLPDPLTFNAKSLGKLLTDDFKTQMKAKKADMIPATDAAKVGFALLKNKKDGQGFFDA